MTEEWRPVAGYDGIYEVSNLGRVRSIEREILHPIRGHSRLKSRILRPGPVKNGYLAVSLCKDGVKKTHQVHGLVCLAFIGNKSPGLQVAHYDGDKENCRLDNLRFCTAKENAADKHRHGTTVRGERHPKAKLTAIDVMTIRKINKSARAIAEIYGVSPSNILSIRARKHWRHIA